RIVGLDRRVVPGLDPAVEDGRDNRCRQIQPGYAGQVVGQRDRADHDGKVEDPLALEVSCLCVGNGRIRGGHVDLVRGQVVAARARAVTVVVDRHVGLDRLKARNSLFLEGELERRSAGVERAADGDTARSGYAVVRHQAAAGGGAGASGED